MAVLWSRGSHKKYSMVVMSCWVREDKKKAILWSSLSKRRHKKKLYYGRPIILLGKGIHKKVYSMVVMSYWVREGTKRSYGMVLMSCWVREDKK